MKKFSYFSVVIIFIAISIILTIPIYSDDGGNIKNGDYILFGTYNNEEILWRIIDIDPNKGVLLWSNNIITLKSYDSTGNKDYSEDKERERVGSNFWNLSTLREWLNSDEKKVAYTHNPPDEKHIWEGLNDYENEPGFLNNFSSNEKDLINTTINKSILAKSDSKFKDNGNEIFDFQGSKNPSNSVRNYQNAYSHNVSDKVFLLDIKQLSDFVVNRNYDYKKIPTKKSIDLSELKMNLLSSTKFYAYWIRTPIASTSSGLMKISPDGVVGDVAIDNRNLGVVPAMYIKPNFYILSGIGTQESPFTIGLENNAYKIPNSQDSPTPIEKTENSPEDNEELQPYNPKNLETMSSWAIDGIEYLKSKNILDNNFYNQYRKNITRKELAYVAVKFYEYITGTSNNPPYVGLKNLFNDTNDEYVIKAFYYGIMNGYGNSIFGADDEITREQVMTLIIKLLSRASIHLYNQETDKIVFKDESKISTWAKEFVKKAYHYKIINGIDVLKIAPKNKFTKEQTFVMLSNIIKNLDILKETNTKRSESSSLKAILKWAYGGTYETWAEDGWYSTPALADLDKNGTNEIIGASYSISCLDAITGKPFWRIPSGHDITEKNLPYEGRTWADVIAEDIDKDGDIEIITAHNKGYISVYSSNGNFKKGWPQRPVNDEIRGLKIADLDLDGKMEIIASAARNSAMNTWVYNCDGILRKGWPQLDSLHDAVSRKNSGMPDAPKETSFAWGLFNNSISIGDVNNDKYPEIIVPSDVPFVCAYDRNGILLNTNQIFNGRKWGQVGFWESEETENKNPNEGWGLPITYDAPSSNRNTLNFANSGSTIDDLDGDGTNEIIISGNVYDRLIGHPPGLYTGIFVLNGDRTRFNKNGFDWRKIPQNTGSPLTEDYYLIEACMPNPVTSDIDNDGLKEILFSSYDGKVHCFSLDKEEKNNWPFKVYDPQTTKRTTYEFASEPTVVDINNDNFKEIIFSTWTEKEPNIDNKTFNGRLIILNYKGELLNETELPFSLGTKLSNGSLPSPLVSDIDNDGKYEIILNTTFSGMVAYDIE